MTFPVNDILARRGPAVTAMRFTVVLVSLIYLTGSHGVHCGVSNAGPYKLKLLRHELCEDQAAVSDSQEYNTVNKTALKGFLQGNVTLPFDFDDNLKGGLNIFKLGTEGWGKKAYTMKFEKFCLEFQNNFPMLFEYIFKSWGIEKPSCPIKAGNYTLDLDTDLPPLAKLPMLPYGSFKIRQFLFNGDPPVTRACNVWYVNSTERSR